MLWVVAMAAFVCGRSSVSTHTPTSGPLVRQWGNNEAVQELLPWTAVSTLAVAMMRQPRILPLPGSNVVKGCFIF